MINKRTKDFDILIEPYNNEYFKVDFPGQFNKQMLEAVRNIPGRRWNNDEKNWLLPHNQTVVNQLLKNLYTTGLFNGEEKKERHFCTDTTEQPREKYIASQIRKVKETLTTRHYSEHTKTSYIKWIEDFLNINQGKQTLYPEYFAYAKQFYRETCFWFL